MSKTRIHVTVDEDVAEAIPEYVNTSAVVSELLEQWAEKQGYIEGDD